MPEKGIVNLGSPENMEKQNFNDLLQKQADTRAKKKEASIAGLT